MFQQLIRTFWLGYIKALAAYAATQPPPADIMQLMEDIGWNAAQDDIVAQDTNYVPQTRTIV